MILDDIVSWLHNSQNTVQVIPQIVSLEDVHKGAIDAETTLRNLLSKYHAIKFNPKHTPGELSSALLDIKKQEQKIDFIQFCRQKIQHQKEFTQTELAMNFMVLNSDFGGHLEKLKALYWSFLNYDEAQAVSSLKETTSILNTDKKILFGFSLQNTAYYLSRVETLMQGQKNPMGVVTFGQQYLADYEKFAAFVLYFLKQGVKSEVFIQTGLLHQFLLYNITEIGFENNEVQCFYDVIKEYGEGMELYHAANEVSLNSRGFECYSLTGTLNEIKTLKKIDIFEPEYAFTDDIENFKSLRLLFGNSFIHVLIQWYTQSRNRAAKRFLEDLLNQQLSNEQLAQIIKEIAGSNLVLLSALADLITDETLTHLAKAKVSEILYFVAYKPELCSKVGIKEVEQYFQQFKSYASTPYDMVPALLFLLKTFSRVNPSISDFIFEKILRILVENPQLLDDESVYHQIKKYPHKKSIIEKKIRETECDFMGLLMTQCSQFPFLIRHYHMIEDAWVKALSSVTLYNALFEQKHTIPRDKYMLYASILKALYTQKNSDWTFDNLMSFFQIDGLLKPTEKTPYERTLSAILIVLDDKKTRLAIIRILKEKYSNESSFNQLILGLFDDAVEHDNPGLISWILNSSGSIPSQEMIDNAMGVSAVCAQWRLVNVFLQQAPDVLESKTLALVVARAVEKGEILILNNLLKNHSKQLKKEAINQAFILATTHNQLGALGLLVNYYDFLSKDDAMVAKGLGVALACQHIAAAQFLIDIKHSSLIKGKIESFLKKAFKDKNVKIIEFLIGLNVNQPSRQCVESLFERACALGNIIAVQCVFQLNKIELCKGSMNASLIYAAKRGHLNIVEYLCVNSSQFDLENLKIAQKKAMKAKHNSVSTYLRQYIANYEEHLSTVSEQRPFNTPLLTHSFFCSKTESIPHNTLMALSNCGHQK